MVTILIVLFLLGAIAIPGIWVERVLQRYSEPADRYRGRGSGAELARHLLDRSDLHYVAVEVSPVGDHYDPEARAVRLVEDRYHGHSLTAITVAPHEVGHAILDARSERLFRNSQQHAQLAVRCQQVVSLVMLAAPFFMLMSRSPGLWLAFLAVDV